MLSLKHIYWIFFFWSIITQAQVQWASKVLEFSSEMEGKQQSASQAIGEPNAFPQAEESPVAWRPGKFSSDEYIKVGFANPIPIQQIVVAENSGPSVISRVSVFDSLDQEYEVKTFSSAVALPKGRLLYIELPKTQFRVNAVRLVLNYKKIYSKAQIDAIGIMSTKGEIDIKLNEVSSTRFTSQPQNMGAKVNSAYKDFIPVITADGNTLFFCRGDDPNNIGNKGYDIWFSKRDENGIWQQAQNIGSPLNTWDYNALLSVTPDAHKVVLLNEYHSDGTVSKGFSYSIKKSSVWSFPKNIIIDDYYNMSRYNEASIAASSKVLVMTLERKDSHGSKDIYVSFLKNNESWSAPLNLGNDLNTAGNESSPFLSADERTLYFSSNGRKGYGSMDIYMSRRLDTSWQKWSEPINLGGLINSEKGDGYFSVSADGKEAFFVSSKNSMGDVDIFTVGLPKELSPYPVSILSGKVINKMDGTPLEAEVFFEKLANKGEQLSSAFSELPTGSFSLVLPSKEKYLVYAQCTGFVPFSKVIESTESNQSGLVLEMIPLKDSGATVLNSSFIWFESNSAEILNESILELNKIVKVLQSNPELKLAIIGHTDEIGSEEDNLILSKKRAESVKDYMVQKGIIENRIRTDGKGESEPLSPFANPKSIVNSDRRVEFVFSR